MNKKKALREIIFSAVMAKKEGIQIPAFDKAPKYDNPFWGKKDPDKSVTDKIVPNMQKSTIIDALGSFKPKNENADSTESITKKLLGKAGE